MDRTDQGGYEKNLLTMTKETKIEKTIRELNDMYEFYKKFPKLRNRKLYILMKENPARKKNQNSLPQLLVFFCFSGNNLTHYNLPYE